MPFDVQGARDAGYSNDEIINHLLAKRSKGFDLQGARGAGWDDEEIIHYLDTGKGFDASPAGRPQAVARGINTGLANVLGAPVDLVNWGLGKAGLPVSEKPFLGSDSIKSGLDTVGGAASRALGGTGGRLTYDDVNDLPPIERPFAVGGEVIGSSIPLAVAPLVAARAGVQGPKILKPIMDMARNSPGAFAAGESAAALGAAQAGGAAEMFDPGDKTTRAIAEIAGSILNPIGAVTRLGRTAASRTKDAVVSRMSNAGRRQRAAEYIKKAFAETGEDPADVIKALNTDIPEGLDLKLTAGQWSNSPTLLAIEKKVAESRPDFGSRADANAKVALTDLREAAMHTEKYAAMTGDPKDLTTAAKARASYYDDVIKGRLRVANERLDKLKGAVNSEGLDGQRMASRQAYDILDGALSDARKIETELWQKVPRGTAAPVDATRSAYQKVREGMLPDETLPPAFESFIARTANSGPVESNQLMLLRSRALAEAKRLRATKDFAGARNMTLIAEGALDDLVKVQGPEAEAARSFSRSLHDNFTRTFAGDALGEKATGADRINPELLLERAFGTGRNPGVLRMRELQGATAFPTGDASPMLNAQERFLRGAFDKSVDPATGKINNDRLNLFLRDNDSLLSQFPDLKQQMAQAGAEQTILDRIGKLPNRASLVAKRNTALGKLLRNEGREDPVGAVVRALEQPREYQGLVNMTRKAGDEAVAGLRTATIEAVARRSTDEGGNFSFDRFRNALAGGDRPFLDQMVDRGQMGTEQAARMRTILTRATRIQQALDSGARRGDIFDSPDVLTDFVVRSVGAHLGAAAPGNQSLLQASAGSRYAQSLFNKVPQTRITEALVEILENKELSRMVLERTTSPARKAEVERQLNAALIQAGLIPDNSDREKN